MSMEIKLDRALTREERAYLEARGEHQRVQQIDSLFPPDYDPNTPEQPEIPLHPTVGSPFRTPLSEYSTEELEAELEARDDGSEEDDEDDDLGTGEDSDDAYEDMTVPELQAELKRRRLTQSGTKPELVARLRENDAQQP